VERKSRPARDIQIGATPQVWSGDPDPVGTFRRTSGSHFAQILWIASPPESTVAKVYQNKRLQLRLESTLTKKHGDGGRGAIACRRRSICSNLSRFLSDSCALFCTAKNSTLFFSISSALFAQKHPGWGYSRNLRQGSGISRTKRKQTRTAQQCWSLGAAASPQCSYQPSLARTIQPIGPFQPSFVPRRGPADPATPAYPAIAGLTGPTQPNQTRRVVS